MSQLITKIFDAETGQEIERPMTAEETKIHESYVAQQESDIQVKLAKEAEKQSILNRLGLTAEEAALLLK